MEAPLALPAALAEATGPVLVDCLTIWLSNLMLAERDSEAAARRLWSEAGLRVLPGAYMGRVDAQGRHPGRPYVRVALVHEAETVEDALGRLAATLAPDARGEDLGS